MWFLFYAVVILFITFLYLWYWKEKQRYKDVDKLPGPPTKFFFGNAKEFGNTTVESFYACQRLIKTYGSLLRVWQGPFRLNLFVTDPKYVEYFLSSSIHLKKSSGYVLFEPLIGQGLITNSGEKWRKHRRIITPAFHFKILEQFSTTFHKASLVLVKNLKDETGGAVDINEYILKYALDIICESSMRINIGAQEGTAEDYIKANSIFLDIFFKRFFSVVMRNDFLFRFYPEYKDHKRTVEYLHDFTMGVIQKRKRERTEEKGIKIDEFGIKRKKAFLDMLLDANELSDEELREEVDTFILAGYETVTSGISFGLFELAKHPDIQEKLLEEIHDVIGADVSIEITMKHLQEMKFFDCVVKEILRMHPPAPLFERELIENVELDGMKIPSGTTISFHPYSQHRNEKYFPDPEKFDPDRFLPHNTLNRHPFAFIPFSAGPRNCIGSKYALTSMKTVMANIIRNFVISPVVPAHIPLLTNTAVMKSVNGLPIILKFRGQ